MCSDSSPAIVNKIFFINKHNRKANDNQANVINSMRALRYIIEGTDEQMKVNIDEEIYSFYSWF